MLATGPARGTMSLLFGNLVLSVVGRRSPRKTSTIIGLPLLRVLTQVELRAVLAHLARGDATGAARSARFVEGLKLAVEQAGTRARGPLGAWARFCLREASWLIEPVARGQEARADRMAAIIAGGGAAASALVGSSQTTRSAG